MAPEPIPSPDGRSKSSEKSGGVRKSKSRVAPAPLVIASQLEEASTLLEQDISALSIVDSPSHMSVTAFTPNASITTAVGGMGPTAAYLNPFASPNEKLNQTSIDTVNLNAFSRPASPEKQPQSSKKASSKKDKKSSSPNKEKMKKRAGAHAFLSEGDETQDEGGFSLLGDDSSSPKTRKMSPNPAKKSPDKARPVDDQDPSGSMRFAPKSKLARQNPSLLMQQPSRVLQKLMEDQEGAADERK